MSWIASQDWLTVEQLPAYAPDLSPVERSPTPPSMASAGSAASSSLAWSFLAHTGLTLDHPPPNF